MSRSGDLPCPVLFTRPALPLLFFVVDPSSRFFRHRTFNIHSITPTETNARAGTWSFRSFRSPSASLWPCASVTSIAGYVPFLRAERDHRERVRSRAVSPLLASGTSTTQTTSPSGLTTRLPRLPATSQPVIYGGPCAQGVEYPRPPRLAAIASAQTTPRPFVQTD